MIVPHLNSNLQDQEECNTSITKDKRLYTLPMFSPNLGQQPKDEGKADLRPICTTHRSPSPQSIFLLFPWNFCYVGGAREEEGAVGRGGGALEVEQREGERENVFSCCMPPL